MVLSSRRAVPPWFDTTMPISTACFACAADRTPAATPPTSRASQWLPDGLSRRVATNSHRANRRSTVDQSVDRRGNIRKTLVKTSGYGGEEWDSNDGPIPPINWYLVARECSLYPHLYPWWLGLTKSDGLISKRLALIHCRLVDARMQMRVTAVVRLRLARGSLNDLCGRIGANGRTPDLLWLSPRNRIHLAQTEFGHGITTNR